MAEGANLPDEIIVIIISWLPVRSLLKFTSVCKRWRSIISFDKDFANELRRNKTLNRRLLACTQPTRVSSLPKLESLDLETLGKNLGRELNFPFQPTTADVVSLLGSCNGLVILAQNNVFSVFNPLTRFVKELPRQGYPPNYVMLCAYGFGYLSATDEYNAFVSYYIEFEEFKMLKNRIKSILRDDEVVEEERGFWVCEVISLRDQIWRKIKGPRDFSFDYPDADTPTGILLNEVLHWLIKSNEHDIVTFDLGKEEFSKIRLPDFGQDGKNFSHLGVCFGGCLYVSRYQAFKCDSIDFWVMREYRVSQSWAKHITLRFTNPQRRWELWPILVMDDCTIASKVSTSGSKKIRFSHKQEQGEAEPSLELFRSKWDNLIEYEESLVSILQI